MAELKTKATGADVEIFLRLIGDREMMEDSLRLLQLMQEISGSEAVMWGPSIIGFGKIVYHYESGREGNWFSIGFSPRKQHLVVYTMTGFEVERPIPANLGKFKAGKSCLYIKRLSDVNVDILRTFLKDAFVYASKWQVQE